MAIRPTTVTLSKDSPRYEEWLKAFGAATVEVTAPLPHIALVRGERKEVFRLDLDALDSGQRRRLVEHISEKFGAPPGEVERTLKDEGLAILTDDVTWSMDYRWFA